MQSYLLGLCISWLILWLDRASGLSRLQLLSAWPLPAQLAFFLVTHDLYIASSEAPLRERVRGRTQQDVFDPLIQSRAIAGIASLSEQLLRASENAVEQLEPCFEQGVVVDPPLKLVQRAQSVRDGTDQTQLRSRLLRKVV